MAKVISGGQQGEPSEKAGRGRGGGGWFRGKVKFAVIGVAILCAAGIFAGKNDDMHTLGADGPSEATSVMQDVTVGTMPDSMPADDAGTVPVDSNAVEITDVRLDVDDRGRPIVLMSVTWTNNDDRGRSFQSTVTCDVSQAGETLSSASSHSEGMSDRVEPGETIVATCGYRLVDTSAPIDVKLAIPSDENDSGISQSFEPQSLEGYISVGDSNIGSSYLSIDGAAITMDPSGKPQISVTAAWTNNDLDPSAFTFAVSDIAKQGDVKLTSNHDDAAREDVPFAKTCSIVLSYELDNYDAPVHCEFSKHGEDVDDGVVTCDFVLADLDGFGEIIQPLIEAEAQARLEEEQRAAQAEAERIEREQREAAEKAEADRIAAEKAAKAEADRIAAEKAAQSSAGQANTGNDIRPAATTTYILNTSTMVVHKPGCRHVGSIKPENYKESASSLDDIKAAGYKGCGHCHTK